LILLQRGFAYEIEKVAGVERGVSAGVESVAVKFVGAGLGDDVDDGAVIAAVFGGKIQGLDLDFLDGVERGEDQRRAAEPFVVVGVAIENEIIAAGGGAVGDEAVVESGGAGGRGDVGDDRGVGGGYAGLEGNELIDVAAVEGKIGDFAGGESVCQASFFGLNERGVGGYFDGFGDAADLQDYGEAVDDVDADDEIVADQRFESFCVDVHAIGAGG